jgi:hypothetical protein
VPFGQAYAICTARAQYLYSLLQRKPCETPKRLTDLERSKTLKKPPIKRLQGRGPRKHNRNFLQHKAQFSLRRWHQYPESLHTNIPRNYKSLFSGIRSFTDTPKLRINQSIRGQNRVDLRPRPPRKQIINIHHLLL